MKAALAFVLIIALTSAIKVTKSPQKLQSELEKSNFGRAILHLVELHSMAGGAVQELVDAIEELSNDLEVGIENLDLDFKRRTNEHNALVSQLTQAIQDAEIDVSRSDDVIQNLLIPRRDQLVNKIEILLEYQEANRGTRSENELQRSQEQEAYELQMAEYNDATASVDEALNLLGSLTNPSMLQVKKFQNSLKKIEQKIKNKTKMAPFVKALISLASNQNFSDQSVLGTIVNALNEFRNQIVDAMNALTAQEAENEVAFQERIEQLDSEYAEFQRQINAVNVDLTATNEKLDQVTEFRDQREADRKTYNAQLDLENETYAQETQIYTDTRNEYQRELAIAEAGLALVNSVDFSNIKV